MNLKISGLIAGLALVALSSCSVYKSGQTPDDVYYSPGNTGIAAAKGGNEEYLETNSRRRYNDAAMSDSYRDDQYMRMMIASGRRPYFQDDFMMMDPWMRYNWRWNSYMTWNSPFNSHWNSMYMWNSFYNPYIGFSFGNWYNPWYGGGGFGNWGGGKFPNAGIFNRPSRPVSAFGMSSYLNTNSGNRNTYKPSRTYSSDYNNNNRNYNSNQNRRSIFSGNESSSDRPSRSYSPSSSGSSNRSSGSSGGGVSRPTRRGGN